MSVERFDVDGSVLRPFFGGRRQDDTAEPVWSTALLDTRSFLSANVRLWFRPGGHVTFQIEQSPVNQIRTWLRSPLRKHQEKRFGYVAVLEEDENGGYVATIPTLVGCITEGDTPEQALTYLRDAMEGWIEVAQRRGLTIPDPDGVC